MAQKAARKKGFRIPARTATLTFEGTPYEGAEVKVRLNVPLGVILDLQSTLDDEEVFSRAVEFASTALISWNLIDQNEADIPPDVEGVRQVPIDLLTLIVQKWVEVVANPPDPLGPPSPNGNTWAEPLIATDNR